MISMLAKALSPGAPRNTVPVAAMAAVLAAVALFGGLAAAQDEAPVATVNGTALTQDAFLERLIGEHGDQLLQVMVNELLIIQEAERRGITADEQAVAMELQKIRSQFPDTDAWEAALAGQGLTEAALAHQLRLELIFDELFAEETQVNIVEVHAMYEQTKDNYQGADEAMVLDYIAEQLRAERMQAAVSALLMELHETADISMSLHTVQTP